MVAAERPLSGFARFASTYDAHSGPQAEAGRRLLASLPAQEDVTRILEVGCGTGRFTASLRRTWPQAEIVAVDAAEPMIAVAGRREDCPGVRFATGDITGGVSVRDVDLVVANAALHWLTAPGDGLTALAAALRAGGTLAFSVFGPATYGELAEVLTAEGLAVVPTSRQLPDRAAWQRWLAEAGLAGTITRRCVTRNYPTLWDLLRTIKYSGTQGPARGALHFSRTSLQRLEAAYRRRCGSITATYEILLAAARRLP